MNTTLIIILAVIPLALIDIVMVIICIKDWSARDSVRYLPKIVWLLIILCSHPTGWILYLLIGRSDEQHNMPESDEDLR